MYDSDPMICLLAAIGREGYRTGGSVLSVQECHLCGDIRENWSFFSFQKAV